MPVMEVGLYGDMPYADLHKAAEEITDLIEKLPEARRPYTLGLKEKEFWVEVDPKKQRRHHVDLGTIVSSLAQQNVNLPGGTMRTPKREMLVRTMGEVQTAAQIDNIVLRTNDSGRKVRIKDVARTRERFRDSEKLFKVNGIPSINLVIRKQADGDIIRLVAKVKELLFDYKERKGLEQLQFTFVDDISVFVTNRLGVLLNNGYMGIILVLISLLLFLSKGIALIAALGMPIAFLGALLVMNLMGMTINLLTMFALVIVLGMLVDDAIIVAENIWQHYERGKSPQQATIDGVKEVFFPVSATILTTIAAFSPLLMVSGIFGKFIEAMPKVVIVCLVISLIEAMFILPTHAMDVLRLGKRKPKPVKDKGGKPRGSSTGLLAHAATDPALSLCGATFCVWGSCSSGVNRKVPDEDDPFSHRGH